MGKQFLLTPVLQWPWNVLGIISGQHWWKVTEKKIYVNKKKQHVWMLPLDLVFKSTCLPLKLEAETIRWVIADKSLSLRMRTWRKSEWWQPEQRQSGQQCIDYTMIIYLVWRQKLSSHWQIHHLLTEDRDMLLLYNHKRVKTSHAEKTGTCMTPIRM